MARLNAAWNRAVAMSCIVRVILRMLRTALRRLTSTLRLAIVQCPPVSPIPLRSGRGLRVRLEVADDAADLLHQILRQVAGAVELLVDLRVLIADVIEE